jgi:hypothetical protein
MTSSSPKDIFMNTSHGTTIDEMTKQVVTSNHEIENSYLLTDLDSSTNRSSISPNTSGNLGNPSRKRAMKTQAFKEKE